MEITLMQHCQKGVQEIDYYCVRCVMYVGCLTLNLLLICMQSRQQFDICVYTAKLPCSTELPYLYIRMLMIHARVCILQHCGSITLSSQFLQSPLYFCTSSTFLSLVVAIYSSHHTFIMCSVMGINRHSCFLLIFTLLLLLTPNTKYFAQFTVEYF